MKNRKKQLILLLILPVLLLVFLADGTRSVAQNHIPDSYPDTRLDEFKGGFVELTDVMASSILGEVSRAGSSLEDITSIRITSLEQKSENLWLASIGYRNYSSEAKRDLITIDSMVAISNSSGEWQVGVYGSEKFTELVGMSDTELDVSYSTTSTTTVDYKFPWASGDEWKWWYRGEGVWHEGDNVNCALFSEPLVNPTPTPNYQDPYPPTRCAIDFGANGTDDKRVLASAPGKVISICNYGGETKTVNVKIEDSDDYSVSYYHISRSTLGVGLNDNVSQGDYLGLVETSNFNESCGYAEYNTAGHVHLVMDVDELEMDSWTFDYPSNCAEKSGENDKCTTSSLQPTFESTNTPTNSCYPSGSPWVVDEVCYFSGSASVSGDLQISSEGLLVIEDGAALNFDFVNNKILVEDGGKIIIKSQGKIY